MTNAKLDMIKELHVMSCAAVKDPAVKANEPLRRTVRALQVHSQRAIDARKPPVLTKAGKT